MRKIRIKDFGEVDWDTVELNDWIEGIGELLTVSQVEFVRLVGSVIQLYYVRENLQLKDSLTMCKETIKDYKEMLNGKR